MTRDTLFIVRGERFESQAALERRVKEELDTLPFNQVTVNPFLQAVVNNYHPSFIEGGVCSSGEFEYLTHDEQSRRGMDTAVRYRGGKLMTTRVLPQGEWHDCTVYPWRRGNDPRPAIVRALRQKSAFLLPRPQSTDRCAVAGCPARGDELEYNHVTPTFKEIAEACLHEVNDDELQTLFHYNKFVPGRDHLVHCIPDDHPAAVTLRDLHRGNIWEWLCAFHHRGVAASAPKVAQPVLDL